MGILWLTGSTGALASAIRAKYLAEGWSAAGFSRSGDGFTHERYRTYHADLTNEDSVQQSFATAMADTGAPTALIATVGGVRPWKLTRDTKIEDFRALLELNLVSFFLAAKHGMSQMTGGGSIISIGAEPALEPSAKKGGYVAAKAGVIALTRVLAEEGKSSGITANCIVPTIIRTEANEEWGSLGEIPKWTKPEDIAAMCYFLTSEAGKAVNGATIRMPGKM